jgi:hypothetical protein
MDGDSVITNELFLLALTLKKGWLIFWIIIFHFYKNMTIGKPIICYTPPTHM